MIPTTSWKGRWRRKKRGGEGAWLPKGEGAGPGKFPPGKKKVHRGAGSGWGRNGGLPHRLPFAVAGGRQASPLFSPGTNGRHFQGGGKKKLAPGHFSGASNREGGRGGGSPEAPGQCPPRGGGRLIGGKTGKIAFPGNERSDQREGPEFIYPPPRVVKNRAGWANPFHSRGGGSKNPIFRAFLVAWAGREGKYWAGELGANTPLSPPGAAGKGRGRPGTGAPRGGARPPRFWGSGGGQGPREGSPPASRKLFSTAPQVLPKTRGIIKGLFRVDPGYLWGQFRS